MLLLQTCERRGVGLLDRGHGRESGLCPLALGHSFLKVNEERESEWDKAVPLVRVRVKFTVKVSECNGMEGEGRR